MTEPVIIANRPFWARVFTFIWAIEVFAGLGFAAGGAGMLGGRETGVAVVLIAAGLLLSVVGVVMTGISSRSAGLRGPAVEMRREGFRDYRISDTVISWDKIGWDVVFNGRAYSLQVEVDPALRKTMKVYWAQAAMGRFNRLFNYPELTVLTLGTGLTAHQLGELMSRFRPQTLHK